MNLLSPEPGTIFWTALTFLILLLILRKMAWGPILQALEERERKIKESLEKADAVQRETEEAAARSREILESAKREAQDLLAKSRVTAEATKEEILEKARSEAAGMLEKAKREIDAQREKAIEEIRREAADLSVAIASKLIGRSLSKEDHRALIEESLQKMAEAN